MAKKLKAVRAWAVVNESDRVITVHTQAKWVAEDRGRFYCTIVPCKYRVAPVVIVPAAEYRAMRAAQKFFDRFEAGQVSLDAWAKYTKAKGKVKRGK